MAPVAAATSGNSSGATKSKIQSIASPGPAMKPSSDIDRFTTTLPIPVLVSLILFLQRTLGRSRDPFRRLENGGQRLPGYFARGQPRVLARDGLLGHAPLGRYG